MKDWQRWKRFAVLTKRRVMIVRRLKAISQMLNKSKKASDDRKKVKNNISNVKQT